MSPCSSTRTAARKSNRLQSFDFVVFDEIEEQADTHQGSVTISVLLQKEQTSLLDAEENSFIETIFSNLVERLNPYKQARDLIQRAEYAGYALGLSDLETGGHSIDTQRRILWLDHEGVSPEMLLEDSASQDRLLISMLRGLRDVNHEMRLGTALRLLRPEDGILLERFRSADCDAVTTSILWSMRQNGERALWRQFLTSEEGDIAAMWQRCYEATGYANKALCREEALKLAFLVWFEDPSRTIACDHETLGQYDLMIHDEDEETALRAFGRKRLCAAYLGGLFPLKDGQRYLDDLAQSLLSDPSFAGPDDEINQAHLLQLKTELGSYRASGVTFSNDSRSRKLASILFEEKEPVLL